MAAILQKAGIIEALYSAMEKWFARVSGGLAIGTIIICTIMAAMTGIVGAAVAAMGILALPSMLKRKYNVELSVGTICAGGTLGILHTPFGGNYCLRNYSPNLDWKNVYCFSRARHRARRCLLYVHNRACCFESQSGTAPP